MHAGDIIDMELKMKIASPAFSVLVKVLEVGRGPENGDSWVNLLDRKIPSCRLCRQRTTQSHDPENKPSFSEGNARR
jgi:hypothetical protein